MRRQGFVTRMRFSLRGRILIFSTVAMMACSHAPVVPQHAFQSSHPNQVTIAVVGINDFHGNLLPKERKLSDGTVIQSGGASALFQMISVLKKEMNGNVLIVDAGDEWQGTLESNLVKGESVIEFYNRLGVAVAAIGNHEFDFSIETMNRRFKEAKFPYVASNIFEKKTGRRPQWNGVSPTRMLTIAGIKFGVIGVSTVNTPSTTRYEYVNHLDFKVPAPIVSEYSTQLRKAGANVVLVTAHAGSRCDETTSTKVWGFWTKDLPQPPCDPEGEISKLASGVAPGSLDGIVSGHIHHVTHHFLSGIPTIQDEAYNQHFNVIYYTFDRPTKRLLPELTRIEGVIPICTKFFEKTQHCDVRLLVAGENPKLVDAYFHGVKIVGDPDTDHWLKRIRSTTDKYRSQVVGIAHHALTHVRWVESAFDNWIADVLREKGNADFGVVNMGGTRAPIDAGPVTFDMIFRSLPFDNSLNVVTMTGKEIKLFLQIATSGAHDGVGVSGLQLTQYSYDKQDLPGMDLNQDGKIDRWEKNRLIEVTKSDGSPLNDQKLYTVATYDYLVNGGDDLSWFMSKIPQERINRSFSGYTRDLIVEAFKREKVINTEEKPTYDPANPRIIFK